MWWEYRVTRRTLATVEISVATSDENCTLKEANSIVEKVFDY